MWLDLDARGHSPQPFVNSPGSQCRQIETIQRHNDGNDMPRRVTFYVVATDATDATDATL